MQRLFSTFPSSWPGMGLLILRLVLSAACIAFGLESETGPLSTWRSVGAIACGSFLLAGLWTPAVTIGLALVLLLRGATHRPAEAMPFVLAAVAISLAMLGPGAWSLDAILFGRRKIDFGARDRTQ